MEEKEAVEFLKNLQRLPYLETEGYGEESLHATDSCYEYIPTLAKFEGEWAVGKDGFREKVGDYQFKLMKEQSLAMAAYKKALGNRYDDLFSRAG